nr:MAG TPA: hypothetical protein [Caudoviricetes sp.]
MGLYVCGIINTCIRYIVEGVCSLLWLCRLYYSFGVYS